MPHTTEKPVVAQYIDDLAKEVKSPEDAATLAEWQAEHEAARASALVHTLGKESVVPMVEANGVVVPAQEVAGQHVEGPYNGGAHSAN